MKIHILPILADNYSYVLEADGEAIVIDPGESALVIYFLEKHKLRLVHILNTHHHWDHTDGNLELQEFSGARITGPDDDRIPGVEARLREGDRFLWSGTHADVIETPGHSSSHICFYFPELKALFTGDTVFSMGCGALFEGTKEQMWQSFEKILRLPDDTNIYCGHEYTLANGQFCQKVEPDNTDITARMKQAKDLRRQHLPTIPVTLGTEKKTNVFLRAGSADNFGNFREKKTKG